MYGLAVVFDFSPLAVTMHLKTALSFFFTQTKHKLKKTLSRKKGCRK